MPQRTPLLFGGRGLVRGTGVGATEPTSMADAANATLRPGRTRGRAGLALRATLVGEDALLAVHPIRAQGVGAAIGYNATTRTARLYLVDQDTGQSSLVGSLWTLPAGAPWPRVVCADVWDRLVIAHDEPTYAYRQATRVFTPLGGGITTLTAQLLAGSPGPAPIRFRGVTRYLSYLAGWGYGSENPGDEARPEVVRLSLPDDPTSFRPEHYFLAGQRGHAVLGCYPTSGGLAVRKANESFLVIGSDRPSFGILPLEEYVGVANARLGVTVDGRNYFWSEALGPRVSGGARSDDLAVPLDVSRLPALAIDDGFAVFDPRENAVVFVFGTVGYAWSVPQEAWTRFEYGVRLACGAPLFAETFAGSGAGLGPAVTLTAGAVTIPALAAGALGVPATVAFTRDGALVGGEFVEVWAKPRYEQDGWTRAGQAALAAGTTSVAATFPRQGVTHDVALRVTRNGVPAVGHASGQPEDWPPVCRTTAQTPVRPLGLRAPFGSEATSRFLRVSGVEAGLELFADAPATLPGELAVEAELDQVTTVPPARWAPSTRELSFGAVIVPAPPGTIPVVRARYRGPEQDGAWTALGARVVAPRLAAAVLVPVGAGTWDIVIVGAPEWQPTTAGTTRVEVEVVRSGQVLEALTIEPLPITGLQAPPRRIQPPLAPTLLRARAVVGGDVGLWQEFPV